MYMSASPSSSSSRTLALSNITLAKLRVDYCLYNCVVTCIIHRTAAEQCYALKLRETPILCAGLDYSKAHMETDPNVSIRQFFSIDLCIRPPTPLSSLPPPGLGVRVSGVQRGHGQPGAEEDGRHPEEHRRCCAPQLGGPT